MASLHLHRGCQVPARSAESSGTSTSYPICAPARQHHQRRQSKARSAQPSTAQHDFKIWRNPDDPEEELPELELDISPLATPILSSQKVFDRLFNAAHGQALEHFGAFYSSEMGGVVTNPAFMVLHVDDHMVHRGHAVTDAVHLTDGHLFQLPLHLQRLKQSAQAAGIALPLSDVAITRIILDTTAASMKSNGTVKFWLSAGRGGFGLSSAECERPAFYVLVTSEICPMAVDRTEGWSACTAPIPPKDPSARAIMSNNFLESALAKAYAEEYGANVALFVDEGGHVLQGPTDNFAMIAEDESVLVVPPFSSVPAGLTLQRLMKLLPEANRKYPHDVTVQRIEQRPIHADELLKAKEAFLIGSTHFIVPLIAWNRKPIADGTPGTIALALANVLELDMKPRDGCVDFLPVPYGFLTGMRSQLI